MTSPAPPSSSTASAAGSAAPIVNAAAYKFAALTDLKEKRRRLQRLCQRAQLRGTILLAEEGVNLFVAGTERSVDRLVHALEEEPEIDQLEVKRSVSAYQPFERMLVKIKQEIIACGRPEADPRKHPGRKLPPAELKQWLDEGRPLTLLDTRNDYEIKLGTFTGAASPGIQHFRDFAAAAEQFPAEWRTQPLVMFCTGGIRCEKAGPLLEQLGFADVWQLEGGILKYFEDVGAAHFRGDCFVFDQRVAVDAALRETDAAQCYACQAILTADEQRSPHYVVGESCPFCHRPPEAALSERLAARGAALARIADPLPGSLPYDNRRPIYVAARWAGTPLLEWLSRVAPGMSRDAWDEQISLGRLLLAGVPASAAQQVRPGQRYDHLLPQIVEPDVNANVQWIHEDEALVVIDKPAPLPMHACGRYCKNTLAALLEPIYRPEKLRNAHRLDANTTGLVVFTRSQKMASRLQPQLARGEVDKRYLALVRGAAPDEQFACHAAIAADTAEAGVRLLDPQGLPAATEFRVLERRSDGTTLVEARPLTGRTNQIRLHLWALGLPIVGDPTYPAPGVVGRQQTLDVDDPPMCLHAYRLQLRHPATGEPLAWEAPPPSWAR